jgi:hypothetical protein
MSLSPEQLAQIISALKEQKIDSELLKQSGVESKNDQGPSETSSGPKPSSVQTSGTGPTPAPKQDQEVSDLSKVVQGNPRPTVGLQAFNIVEIASRILFSKDLERKTSTYIPSAHRFYSVLHEIDQILVQNRYFRQSIPSFTPMQSRIYCGIIFTMQIARCMEHVELLNGVADLSFFETFFRRHPVATLPVPGPLIPILQALCVSTPQDGTLPRVSPRLPTRLGPQRADSMIQDAANFALPNIPMLFGLHHALRDMVQQPQNANAGAPLNTADSILNIFGYQGTAATQYHRAGVGNANISINGRDFTAGFAGMNQDHIWSTTCPGIGQPLEINEELISSFRSNYRIVPFPVLAANAQINDLTNFLRCLSGQWFSVLKKNMAVYCRYVKGSGTMQDISVEGPSSGMFVGNVSTLGINAAPTGFFDQSNIFPGDASYTTTLPANDRTAELLAVYAQPHIRVAGHPHPRFNNIGSDNVDNGRDGSFWDVRPLRPPTLNDHIPDSLGEEVAHYVRERADKD